MPICNLKKTIITAAIFSTAASFCFSEVALKMPDMPSMPEAPTVSGVTMDGSFYRPSVPGLNRKNPGINNGETTSNTQSNTNQYLSEASTSEDALVSMVRSSSNLTASDISSLYDNGLFSNLSSIAGIGNTSEINKDSTNVLLQKVLESLEELKTEQKKSKEIHTVRSDSFKIRTPSVLRFKINGYNIADSLTTVFFSEPEADGSFLFTADRKYYVNQKMHTETFYVLFKAQKNTGARVSYAVQPRIVQDIKNENSYIYKFSQLKNLEAEKTGNLVVVKNNDGNTVVDLLLDIDK